MILSDTFLKDNPDLCILFEKSTTAEKQLFFHTLKKLAASDLSLAQSVFKVSAVRTVLSLCPAQQNLIDSIGVAGFSVHKPYDTVKITNDVLNGKKHWITNLTQSKFLVIQTSDHNNFGKFVLVDLTDTSSFIKDFSFLKNPGLADTCTGDIIFNQHKCTTLFDVFDPKSFISANHNSLCFIANYLGAVSGLLDYMTKETNPIFNFSYENLSQLFELQIESTGASTTFSDAFWHQRNALYLGSKNLLVKICQHIISNYAGNFYNLNSPEGKHFADCLIYSGHRGPVIRSRLFYA
jgi:hypothetical protein